MIKYIAYIQAVIIVGVLLRVLKVDTVQLIVLGSEDQTPQLTLYLLHTVACQPCCIMYTVLERRGAIYIHRSLVLQAAVAQSTPCVAPR
jgi:hypothetical protein